MSDEWQEAAKAWDALRSRAERAEADVESLRVIERSYVRAVLASAEGRERAERERDEAQAHARNHHLEACESCAAMQGERDIAEADAAALREALGQQLCPDVEECNGPQCTTIRAALAATDAGAAKLAELGALRRVAAAVLVCDEDAEQTEGGLVTVSLRKWASLQDALAALDKERAG